MGYLVALSFVKDGKPRVRRIFVKAKKELTIENILSIEAYVEKGTKCFSIVTSVSPISVSEDCSSAICIDDIQEKKDS